MAQFRFHNWQDDDLTFSLNQRLMGVLPDGRYRGYEAKPFVAGMNLILWHDVTGYKYIKKDLTSFTKVGCAITKQGMVINETGEISIGILPNLTSEFRIDLIVMEHFYEDIVGGTAATYLSIQGTPSPSPVAPALTDPDKQVIIGYLLVPEGCTSLTEPGVAYTKATTPVLANDSSVFDTAISNIYATIAALNLNSLTDVTITSVASGHILVHNGTEFVNVSSKTHIQTLQLNMTEFFGLSGITHLAEANLQTLVGGGPNEFGYIVTKNLVQWVIGAPSTKKISRLTVLPIGSMVRMVFEGPTFAGLVMGGAGDYGATITDSKARTDTIAIRTNTVYTFIKRSTDWLMVEEMPRANYTQTDPNALDFIQNKPAPFVQTKANWAEASPASNAFIQNKPNVMEVVGRFTLSVGNVGILPIGNAVTVVNNGGFPVQASSATVASNTGGGTQQNSSITVNLINTGSISYLGYFVIYSNGVTADDSLAYPTMKFITFTSFNLGLREVATNITSNVTVEVILIKSPIAL
jgi:hypothetical protein